MLEWRAQWRLKTASVLFLRELHRRGWLPGSRLRSEIPPSPLANYRNPAPAYDLLPARSLSTAIQLQLIGMPQRRLFRQYLTAIIPWLRALRSPMRYWCARNQDCRVAALLFTSAAGMAHAIPGSLEDSVRQRNSLVVNHSAF